LIELSVGVPNHRMTASLSPRSQRAQQQRRGHAAGATAI